MPPLCFQRPGRSIWWVGAPFWAMRRVMPTLPRCPLKYSQSVNPAALAMTFTHRAICERLRQPEHLRLTTNPRRPDGVQSLHGGGSDGHHGAGSLHVGLGADHGCKGRRHQGHVEAGPIGGRLRGFEAAAPKAGLDSGESDDGEDVAGRGASLPLGFRQPPAPTLAGEEGATPTWRWCSVWH